MPWAARRPKRTGPPPYCCGDLAGNKLICRTCVRRAPANRSRRCAPRAGISGPGAELPGLLTLVRPDASLPRHISACV
jgi:hypothetical protein